VTRAENWVPPWRSPHEHTKRDGALQLARLNLAAATSGTKHPESKNPSGMAEELRSNLEERLHGTHNELFDWCSCCADRASSGAQAGLNHAKGRIRADTLELRLTRATHYAGWSNKNRWEELRRQRKDSVANKSVSRTWHTDQRRTEQTSGMATTGVLVHRDQNRLVIKTGTKEKWEPSKTLLKFEEPAMGE
jgi:hypothetical protein